MSKPKHPRTVAETAAQAVTRNIRVSPRKLNLVAGLIRGKKVQDAVAVLTFSKRRISDTVKKTLESAIANGENNHQLDVDRLVVSRVEVGRAIVMKRFHARGRGKAARVEKWFSHLSITVAEAQAEAAPAEQEAA
ncbi:50S ribosomal protein L22 [Roseomonas marmotae]|uniref:Large ribosomal subunit protein uL22 n=1 Tax=Roseomonas marmotae TaxID=2768161 RepID=A0ABS3KEP7_9PROT|nr:50S ribosomal protein L22 [Roseomonas marmotae]MBO1075952.1 50S ribosomal protein L22 [Roseomonas marmotae]QTI80087.1 50S ribosomal protein L22 [Roseomonas marmotae]